MHPGGTIHRSPKHWPTSSIAVCNSTEHNCTAFIKAVRLLLVGHGFLRLSHCFYQCFCLSFQSLDTHIQAHRHTPTSHLAVFHSVLIMQRQYSSLLRALSGLEGKETEMLSNGQSKACRLSIFFDPYCYTVKTFSLRNIEACDKENAFNGLQWKKGCGIDSGA